MSVFKPRKDQVDFTRARWAPVLICAVQCRGKVLLVRRSKRMHIYPGYWNGIGGYLDDRKTLAEKVREELREEAGIRAKDIISIRAGQIFEVDDPKYRKTWIIHPVLARVRRDRITLDWEADAHRWVSVREARRARKLIPTFRRTLDTFFNDPDFGLELTEHAKRRLRSARASKGGISLSEIKKKYKLFRIVPAHLASIPPLA